MHTICVCILAHVCLCTCMLCTVESLNKGHFGTIFLFFVKRLPSLGGPKCIGTIGRKYLGTSSCVLCREIVLISERPL